MRKAFNTSIDDDIQTKFKTICSEDGIPMNTVLEYLMQAYIDREVNFSLIKAKPVEGQ